MSDESICPQEDCVSTEDLPSIMQMARNFASDGGRLISNALQGNKTLVDDDTRNNRWVICQACPRLQNDRCLECGCFMKVKVAFITSKCPLENW